MDFSRFWWLCVRRLRQIYSSHRWIINNFYLEINVGCLRAKKWHSDSSEKCAWIINGNLCAFFLFSAMALVTKVSPSSFTVHLPSGSNLFSNIHELGGVNDYYSVIFFVSCLSCDYYVRVHWARGGKSLLKRRKWAFHVPRHTHTFHLRRNFWQQICICLPSNGAKS